MFTEFLYLDIHSSAIPRNPKLETTKQPSAVEWMGKVWCIHTMQFYTAMRTNELKLQVIKMHLTNLKLIKRSQTQKFILYDSM